LKRYENIIKAGFFNPRWLKNISNISEKNG